MVGDFLKSNVVETGHRYRGTTKFRGGGKLADLRDAVIKPVSSLRINLSQVKIKLPVIERVKSKEFWDEITVGDLEEIRDQLRGIVHFRRKDEEEKGVSDGLNTWL